MNEILFSLFPGGRNKCLTMSYDDGADDDIRLAEIFRTNGIKGTFHLNSSRFDFSSPEKIQQFRQRYDGHEVSCHTVNHNFPVDQPDSIVMAEIQEDKRLLEIGCGYPVRGMSYPFGNYDARTIALYRAVGMEYSRTTRSTHEFLLPEDFLAWHPTCHHSDHLEDRIAPFLSDAGNMRMKIFYVWGHSFEFSSANNWDLIEEFCKKMGGLDSVWYATNIEIVDYKNALQSLRFSMNCDMVFNPSALDVWFVVNGEPVCCPAGKTISF